MLRLKSLLPLATLVAIGCGTPTITFQGDELYKYFPFNGERIGTFQSTDTTLTYLLRSELLQESEVLEDGRTRAYTVEFRIDCKSADSECVEDELAFSRKMSSDSSKGALIHAFGETTFDPPVRLAEAQMLIGATTTTESGGVTYVATYEEVVDCPAPYWRGSPPPCAHIILDDGGAGTELAGEYWATVQFNIVAFTSTATGEEWQLRDFAFND